MHLEKVGVGINILECGIKEPYLECLSNFFWPL
jgi:hypothetical protein